MAFNLKSTCPRADLFFQQKRIISHEVIALTFAYTSDQRNSLWKDTSSTGARSRTSRSPAIRAARRRTARQRSRWTWEVNQTHTWKGTVRKRVCHLCTVSHPLFLCRLWSHTRCEHLCSEIQHQVANSCSRWHEWDLAAVWYREWHAFLLNAIHYCTVNHLTSSLVFNK